MTTLRRALLYLPGDSRRKIDKAASLDVDCICLDLEDGVALNQKEAARAEIRRALSEVNFGRSEVLVRLNPFGSAFTDADLSATAPGHPHGFVLPKVESAEALRWLDARLSMLEAVNDWPPGQLVILAIVETALGILNLREIASATPRLQALIFGAEDLAGDMSLTRTRAAWEVLYARSAIVTHAAALGLQAIDMVWVDFNDTAGLVEECTFGMQLGYTGKQIIHPNQVAPVHTAFAPTPAAIAHAQRVIAAHEAHQASGQGAFALDGKMVDRPVVRAAENVLAKARAAGLL